MGDTVFDRGVVTRLEDGKAFVSIRENEACENCGAKLICAPNAKGDRGILARNPLHASPGQAVQVTESRDILLRLSLLQYGLPLVGFLLGIFLLYSFAVQIQGIPQELLLFIGGLAGLGLSSVLAWKLVGNLAQGQTMYFEISKILNEG